MGRPFDACVAIRRAVPAVIAVLTFSSTTLLAQQKLNVQVSDPSSRPVKNLQITTGGTGTTETTDNAGKATITFSPGAGTVELVIVSPANLDFLSPWQRSVTVPPQDWSIVVTTKGNRDLLEHPKAVAALAARTSHLESRKSGEDPPLSPETRRIAITKVAKEVGVEPQDLTAKIEALTAPQNDAYIRAMGFLDQHDWGRASELFNSVLNGSPNPDSSDSIEQATNSAFFLGQALFEQGLFSNSAAAYETASKFRPNDPVILNNEGLSLSKSGDFKRANEVYERAIKIMKDTGMAKTLNYSTTTNNLAALRAYQGDFQGAKDLFEKSLALRTELLPPNDSKIVISLNNVAAMQIVQGDCNSADANLRKALQIEKKNSEVPGGNVRQPNNKAIVALGNDNKIGVTGGENQSPGTKSITTVAGKALASSTPGDSTMYTNLAMVYACNGNFAKAREILLPLLSAQQRNPTSKSDIGNILLNLAWVEEAQSNWSLAESYYQQAITNYKSTLGLLHPQVAVALTDYGEMLIRIGKNNEAAETLKEAIRITNHAFGDNSDSARRLTERVASIEKKD